MGDIVDEMRQRMHGTYKKTEKTFIENENHGTFGQIENLYDDKSNIPYQKTPKNDGTYGMFPIVPINPILPNNPILPINTKIVLSNKVKTLNLKPLDIKEKIIAYCYDNKVEIDDLMILMNEERNIIQRHITRSDRKDGLLDQDLLEVVNVEGKEKTYTSTNKGKSIIDDILKEQTRIVELQTKNRKERETEDDLYNNIKGFLELHESELLEIKRKKIPFVIDFKELIKEAYYINGFSERVINKPTEMFEMVSIIIEKLFEFRPVVRIKNLPSSLTVPIGDIRSHNNGELVKIKGTPVGITKVLPKVKVASFECTGCGRTVNIIQKSREYKKPSKCPCGEGGFKVIKEEIKDIQFLKIEECPEEMGNRVNPQIITIILEDELTTTRLQPYFEESKPIVINGIIDTELRGKGKESIGDYQIIANFVDLEVSTETVLTPTDIEKIKEFVKKPDFKKELIASFAPAIINRDKEKEALILSSVSGGGNNKGFRDDSHILLIGDPSMGKSFLLTELRKLLPRSRWVSGNSTSGVGLIGTVKKDEEIGETILSKGALPMANGGIVLCDELDKMRKEDRLALHEPLENQRVNIDKWDKHAEFKADCTFIATMNPKYSRFSDDSPIVDQINLPPSLLSRFDLILVLKDVVNKEVDEEISCAIFNRWEECGKEKNIVDSSFIIKYLTYVRKINPKPVPEIKDYLKKYYSDIRSKSNNGISFSPRQLEGIVRISTGNAKLRLSNKVTIDDLNVAIDLVQFSLKQVATDKNTGLIDVDIIHLGNTSTERKIREFIGKYKAGVDIEKVTEEMKTNEKVIGRMVTNGDIYEIRPGVVKVL